MKINRKSVIVVIAIFAIAVIAFVGGVKCGQSHAANNNCIYAAEDVTGAYNVGYEEGLHDASTML